MVICNFLRTDNICFFDNLKNNLISGKKIGWKTILIDPDYVNAINTNTEEDYIDCCFPNINNALINLLKN